MASTTGVLIIDRRHLEGEYLLRIEEERGGRVSERAVRAFHNL